VLGQESEQRGGVAGTAAPRPRLPPPRPLVPLAEGREQQGEGESERRQCRRAALGTGRRGERGHRSSLLFFALPSRPFSQCPRAGIAPRPRRWSARTAEPSGQRRASEPQGRERWAAEAGAGSRLSGGILGKAPSCLPPPRGGGARPRPLGGTEPGSAAAPRPSGGPGLVQGGRRRQMVPR
jgi:hypothetical protein